MVYNKKFHEVKAEVLNIRADNGTLVLDTKKSNSKKESKPDYIMKKPKGDWSKRYDMDPGIWLNEKYPNPRLAGALYTFPTKRQTYGDIYDGQIKKIKTIYDQATKLTLSAGIAGVTFFTLTGHLYLVPVIFAGLAGYYFKKTKNEKYTYETIDKNFTAIAPISKEPSYPPNVSEV